MASRRRSHLAAVPTRESRPPLVRPWFRQCPRHEVCRWRQLRKPHVEEVELREILLADAPRRAPDSAQARSLPGETSTTEPDNTDGHGTSLGGMEGRGEGSPGGVLGD